uniref:G-protein coupled receptors family 1 profile domain-containing protein n=1 Tax=Falco tinnunculus TaxID=100819 RepID=A0A8C4UFN6_FALTI
MAGRNQTRSASTCQAESLLGGFLGVHKHRLLLLIPFCFLHLLIITANTSLTYTMGVEEDLHSLAYLLITLLLKVSLCSSSTFVPKMLLGFLFHLSHISLQGCMAQILFPDFFITLDYVMTRKYMSWLSLAAVVRNISFVSPVVILASKVHLCHANVIKHFVCEHMALVSLSCGNTSRNGMVGLAMKAITIVFDLGFLLTPYSTIIHTALKTPSGSAEQSLCGRLSEDMHNLISVTYLLLPCGVNPIAYGVRTEEIRQRLLKLLKKEVWCQSPLRQQPQNKFPGISLTGVAEHLGIPGFGCCDL